MIGDNVYIDRRHPHHPHKAVLIDYPELWAFPPDWTDEMIHEAIRFANSRYHIGVEDGKRMKMDEIKRSIIGDSNEQKPNRNVVSPKLQYVKESYDP